MSILSDHIKEFEGLRLDAYLDVAGILTIGYGHTGPDVKSGMKITKARADDLLHKDMQWAIDAVSKSVTVPTNQYQQAALISLTFNIGAGAFKSSTLLRKLNAGDIEGAANEFCRWNKATVGGKKTVINGLTRRRESERALFMTGSDDGAVVPADQPGAGSITDGGRTSIAKSTTMQSAGGQIVAAGGVIGTAVTTTDGTAQILLIVGGFVIVLAAAYIMRERIKKWADGIR